jgi:protein-S-isoprenylcysteine O-methyltransferase Ste14
MILKQLEVRIPPVVLVLFTIAVQWTLARFLLQLQFIVPARLVLSPALAALGTGCIAAGVLAFRKAATTVDPRNPERATSFVIGGIYRWSRNPMYVGFALLVASFGCAMANYASLVMVVIFVSYMNIFQIAPEERMLALKFGHSFEAYRQKVRRWL